MNIDRMEFVAWMERLMDRLDMLGDNIENFQKKRNNIDGEELFNNIWLEIPTQKIIIQILYQKL